MFALKSLSKVLKSHLQAAMRKGNNITVRGTVDATGTMLKANYILNGSASGRCEADGGTGSLAKR